MEPEESMLKIELASGDFFFAQFRGMGEDGRFIFSAFLPSCGEVLIPVAREKVRSVFRVGIPELFLYCNFVGADRPKIDEKLVKEFLGVIGKK